MWSSVHHLARRFPRFRRDTFFLGTAIESLFYLRIKLKLKLSNTVQYCLIKFNRFQIRSLSNLNNHFKVFFQLQSKVGKEYQLIHSDKQSKFGAVRDTRCIIFTRMLTHESWLVYLGLLLLGLEELLPIMLLPSY